MKKFCVILFMSCLLNFVPIAFGADKSNSQADNPKPQMVLVPNDEHGYCWKPNNATHMNPLKNWVEHENDQFINTLDTITQDAQKGVNLSSLPGFSLYLDDKSQNTITLLNPLNPAKPKTDIFSPTLHQLFELESAQDGVTLLDRHENPIAILKVIKTSYNPDNPEVKSDQKVLPHITNTNIKNEKKITETKNTPKEEISNKPSNWRTPLAIGTFVAIVAAALWYNKDLAPSMEAIFTRISSSCQGMFSRISSHTNNLRA